MRTNKASAGGLLASLLTLVLAAEVESQEPLVLSPGQPIKIELAHHLSAAQNPPASPVFFFVAEDVVVDGQTVIAKGAVVRGQVAGTSQGGNFGGGGQMVLLAQSVQAVDGAFVPLGGSFGATGRSRTGAAVGAAAAGSILVNDATGIVAGAATVGGSPYYYKGAHFTVYASQSTEITWEASAERPDASTAELIETRVLSVKPSDFYVNLEAWKKLSDLRVDIQEPKGVELSLDDWKTFAIRRIEGLELPEPIKPWHLAPAKKGESLWFRPWPVLSYCISSIPCDVEIVGELGDGRLLATTFTLMVKIRRG